MHEIVPDQAVRTQQAERAPHVVAVEVALVRHHFLQRVDALFVEEDLDVARAREVDQRGEQRPVRHRNLARRCDIRG